MNAAPIQPRGRDPFEVARESYRHELVKSARGDAALRVGVALVDGFASRKEFEKTGRLVAWPSMRTLSEHAGMFKGKIERGVKSLEASGLLVVERPETRGAGHHNTYVMKFPNVLADGDIKVLGNVDNPISDKVLAGEDISEGSNVLGNGDINVLAGEDAMSSEIGPNLLDERPDGVGALTRPSPDALEGAVIDDAIDHQDANAATSAGAVERARSTGGGSLADRALEAQRLVPASAPEIEPDPAAFHFKDGVDVSLEELDRLMAQAREALARQEAAQALGDALGLDGYEAGNAACEVLNGLLGQDCDDRAKLAVRTLRVISSAAPASRRPIWEGIRRAVRGVVAANGNGTGDGDVAEDALVAAINLATANRKTAVEQSNTASEVEK